MKSIYAALIFSTLTALAMGDEKVEDTRTIEKDGIRMQIGGRYGYNITVDGASFSPISTLFVVDPQWTDRYYGYNDDRARIADATTSGIASDVAGLHYQFNSGRQETVGGSQTIEILPGRRVRIATDIRMTSPTPGVIEHRIASISEAWMTNTTYTAELADGSTTTGQTPRWAPGTLPKDSTLLQDFRSVTFQSPRGPLKIDVSGSAKLTLLDYRRNQWAEGKKYFWFGILGERLPETDPLTYEVVFTFPEGTQSTGPQSTVTETKLHSTSETVLSTPAPEDRIIPTPKELTWGDGNTELGSQISFQVNALKISSIRLTPEIKAQYTRVITDYSNRLKRLYNVTLVAPVADDSPNLSVEINNLTPVTGLKSESYRLRVDPDQITLTDISTTQGLLNGLRTLEQLIRIDKDGKVGVRRAEIYDWPSMPFRGIHFFTGKDARELQLKMVNEILAPLKINNLVYQVDYVKWASQPQIHSEMLSMDKEDAIAVGEAAEQQGIDVIPLVNTFGHSEWLLQRPDMRYLADDPDDPYAYDPSNPKVYEIAEGIYREAIDMFNPTTMHIGHDEVQLDGFPKKPENKAVGATQLFINDTLHYYEWLKKQGIRTMMWGDMLLGPGEAPDATLAHSVEEAKRRRSLLPKDIIITDWHYKSAPVEAYKSPAIFNQEGFDAIGCTWHSADNIVRFARALSNQREKTTQSLGLLQTTWAGYSFDENSLVENLDQYTAYVLAAEAAWTGGYVDSSEVPFDYHKEFLRRWNGELVSGEDKSGWTALLKPSINFSAAHHELSVASDAFANLASGTSTMLGRYGFNIPSINGKPAAVRFAGAWDSVAWPTALKWNAGDPLKTDELYLALATPFWVPDGTKVGELTVTLEDESVHTLPLIYGKNALSISDGRQTLVSPIAWKSDTYEPGQGGAVIHVLRWENPRPGTALKSLQLGSDNAGPGLMLFGVSGTRASSNNHGSTQGL